MGITRRQLKDFGSSDYLAKQLTQGLEPLGRQGRAYLYDTEQVLYGIRSKLDVPNVRKTTKTTLAQLEIELSGLIEAPSTNQRLLDAIAEAAKANARFEQTARKAQKSAKEFQTYKKKQGSEFSAENNIVAFRA